MFYILFYFPHKNYPIKFINLYTYFLKVTNLNLILNA